MEGTKEPRFIQDKPKGIDLFAGASQMSLAKAISQHIIDNDNAGEDALPRILGIEGVWGSGKSNVVKMVEDSLKNKGYHFFVYDAWGNQEDLQRRSLLEQLTDELIKEEILVGKGKLSIRGNEFKDKSWAELLKLLLSHKRETTSTSIPKLNGGLVFGFLAAIATPITSVVSASLPQEAPLWIKFLLASSPILLSIVVWLVCVAVNHKKYLTLSFLLTIYKEGETTTHDYEVISEEEPTVVDFKSWMQSVSKSLNPKKCKKLVIVFDNMDRLPAEKVKQLWSSIHTFFAEKGFPNIWLIIPYDEHHLSCAFGTEETDDALRLTHYFINKTFPVTFTVPKPLITDYKGVFKQYFEMAFGEGCKEEDEINRLYRLTNKEANVREIIIFINRLVGIYKTRHNDVSLTNMAIYQLFKGEIENNDAAQMILSGKYLAPVNTVVSDTDELKAEIAALSYGVDKKLASQIPLTQFINQCLENDSKLDINDFSNNNANFYEILKEVFMGADTAMVNRQIEVLDTLKEQENRSVLSIWLELMRRLRDVTVDKMEVPAAYKIIIKHLDNKRQQILADKLCIDWADIKEFDGETYVKAINDLRTTINEDVNINNEDKAVDAKTFISAVLQAKENIKNYRLVVSEELVDEEFAQMLPAAFNHYDVLRILTKVYGWSFNKFSNKLRKLYEDGDVDEKNVSNTLVSLRYLNKVKDGHIINLVESKTLNMINQLEGEKATSETSGYLDLLAFALANSYNVTIDDKVVEQVAPLVEWHTNGDLTNFILENVDKRYSHAELVIKEIIQKQYGEENNLKLLLPQFHSIVSSFGLTNEEVLSYMNKYIDSLPSFESITSQTKLQELIPQAEFYQICAEHGTDKDLVICNRVLELGIHILENFVTGQELIQQKNNYSSNYWHRLINVSLLYITTIPDCLKTFAENLFENTPQHADTYRGNDYYKNVMKHTVDVVDSTVFYNIARVYTNNNKSITSDAFVLLEEGLRKHGSIDEAADGFVVTVMIPIVGSNDCKSLILENVVVYKAVVDKAKEQKGALYKALSDKWEENDIVKLMGDYKPLDEQKSKE